MTDTSSAMHTSSTARGQADQVCTTTEADAAGQGVLNGITVIDLSRVLAGPLCGQMLADHGARVIKVEPPTGDDTRTWGPPFLQDGTGAYYTALNRGKDNLSLDLRAPAGQEVLSRLLAEADVMIENFKAGTLARWGLDDSTIAERFPRLIHCRITGFGTDGPAGGSPGYDAVLQAYGGLMSVNGASDGPPTRVGVPIADMVTGNLAFAGVLLALRARETTGRGQLIDSTLLDSVVSILHPHSTSLLNGGSEPVRTGSAHPTVAPYDLFELSDGTFFLGIGNDRQFASFTELIGRPELSSDERFASNGQRVINYPELREILTTALHGFTCEDLGAQLLAAGVPGAPVHTVREILDDPQVHHRRTVIEDGDYRGIANPIRLSDTPAVYRFPPRPQGADNAAVLASLGFDRHHIEHLQASGVISTGTRS